MSLIIIIPMFCNFCFIHASLFGRSYLFCGFHLSFQSGCRCSMFFFKWCTQDNTKQLTTLFTSRCLGVITALHLCCYKFLFVVFLSLMRCKIVCSKNKTAKISDASIDYMLLIFEKKKLWFFFWCMQNVSCEKNRRVPMLIITTKNKCICSLACL